MKKQLKQTFTSKKGNLIEIIETDISGQTKHWIKVNGIQDRKPYTTKQLIEIMK